MNELSFGLVRALIVAALAVAPAGCMLLEDDGGGGGDGTGIGATCTRSDNCEQGLVCAGGACQLPGSVELGGPCWATRDCAGGLFCAPSANAASDAGVCAPAGAGAVGDACATAAECEPNLVCRLFGFGGVCAEAGGADLGQSCAEQIDCLAGLACAGDGTCKSPQDAFPPFLGIECADDEDPFRVYFEVPRASEPAAEFFRLPFPTDVRVTDGALDMSGFARPGLSQLGVDLVGMYVDALVDDFEGFSPVGIVTFRFSSKLDFDTTSGDTIQFIDVTPGAPELGSSRGLSWGYTTGRTKWNCQHRLTVRNRPQNPLLPGHTYAVLLTTGLESEAGVAAVQDADLVAVLDDTRPEGDEALGHAWDAHQPLRDYLASASIDPGTIAGAAVFTAMDPARRMQRVADAAAAEPAPIVEDLTLCDGTNVSPCDDGDARACGAVDADYHEIHGRIRVPIYQAGTAPYEFPEDGGAIEFDGDVPLKARDEMVCFAMAIPKAAGGPYPLVVFGHGTGGSFRSMFGNGVARALTTASSPAAVVGFDGVVHGARRNGSDRESDNLMFNVINPRAARDNNLQGAVDVITMLRLPELGAIDIAGVGDVSFDASRVYYFGHSQGSNVGIPALATSDGASAAVLSGAGAFLTSSLLSKTSPVDVAAGLKFLLGEPDFDGGHPVMTVLQTYFDPSDMVNYAPLLIRRPPAGLSSKHVWASYGPGDTFSPPGAIATMAGAAGLQVASPVVDDIGLGEVQRPVTTNRSGGDGAPRFGALFQYEPTDYDGHFVATRDPDAVADWTGFLMSLIESGSPEVE